MTLPRKPSHNGHGVPGAAGETPAILMQYSKGSFGFVSPFERAVEHRGELKSKWSASHCSTFGLPRRSERESISTAATVFAFVRPMAAEAFLDRSAVSRQIL